MEKVLEVCVDSMESALAAKEGGADRIELCGDLLVGGVTPSLSLLRAVKAETALPVHAMVRPRFGDFLYTDLEFGQMLEDAQALLEAGADALVSGFLLPDGDLDVERTGRLVTLAHRAGKRFTLHRAFDACRDPFRTLENCRALGVDTVLTSGQAARCEDGSALLKELFPLRGDVELLLGAGIDDGAILRLGKALPEARSFHLSGKRVVESGMKYRRPGVNMGLPGFSEYEIFRTDSGKIRAAREALNRL